MLNYELFSLRCDEELFELRMLNAVRMTNVELRIVLASLRWRIMQWRITQAMPFVIH